jgi:hypothetical protein
LKITNIKNAKLTSIILFSLDNFSYFILECKRLNLPIISLVDTNINSDFITYPIYSNDDSFNAIYFYLKIFQKLYFKSKQNEIKFLLYYCTIYKKRKLIFFKLFQIFFIKYFSINVTNIYLFIKLFNKVNFKNIISLFCLSLKKVNYLEKFLIIFKKVKNNFLLNNIYFNKIYYFFCLNSKLKFFSKDLLNSIKIFEKNFNLWFYYNKCLKKNFNLKIKKIKFFFKYLNVIKYSKKKC